MAFSSVALLRPGRISSTSGSESMTDLVSTAQKIQEFCDWQGWEFCIIGGLAVQFWGEPRLTRAIDLTLLTGFGGEEVYIDALLSEFPARLLDAKEFALSKRVLLLKSVAGIGIDISLGALPFEEVIVARSERHEYLPGIELRICTAEDLIVLKAFAARDKDWGDIGTILQKQDRLDWNYIFSNITPLAEIKSAPEIIVKLKELRSKYA
jgi:hypothetical protein